MITKYAIRFRWQATSSADLIGRGNRVHSAWPKLFSSREEAQAVIDGCRDIFANLRHKRKLSVSVCSVMVP